MSILVAALGSEIGADIFAWQVIRQLDVLGPPAGVRLMLCRHPGELLPLLLSADRTIILDACVGGGVSGTLRRLDPAEIQSGDHQTHGLGVVEAVRLAIALGVKPEGLLILGLEIGTGAAELQPAWVELAVQELVQILSEQLSKNPEPARAQGAPAASVLPQG